DGAADTLKETRRVRRASTPRAQEAQMQTSTDVLIAGGGPVGLQLAAELQRRGIDHVIIDQRPQPDAFCKALGVTPRTLEVWNQIGVLDDFLRAGTFMSGIQGVVNGRDTETETVQMGTMPYGFLIVPQYETERLLRRHLRRHGGRVQQGARLVGFEARGGDIAARVACDGQAEQTVVCRYLVGCDGAHSAVRKGMGVDYEGDAYAMTFMLGDVHVQWQRARSYGQRFTLSAEDQLQNVFVFIPVPGDPQRYRVSMAAPPEYWD